MNLAVTHISTWKATSTSVVLNGKLRSFAFGSRRYLSPLAVSLMYCRREVTSCWLSFNAFCSWRIWAVAKSLPLLRRSRKPRPSSSFSKRIIPKKSGLAVQSLLRCGRLI